MSKLGTPENRIQAALVGVAVLSLGYIASLESSRPAKLLTSRAELRRIYQPRAAEMGKILLDRAISDGGTIDFRIPKGSTDTVKVVLKTFDKDSSFKAVAYMHENAEHQPLPSTTFKTEVTEFYGQSDRVHETITVTGPGSQEGGESWVATDKSYSYEDQVHPRQPWESGNLSPDENAILAETGVTMALFSTVGPNQPPAPPVPSITI